MKRKIILIIFILGVIFTLNYIKVFKVYTSTITDAMDTITNITLIKRADGEKNLADISDIIEKYDDIFSHTKEESELYKLNRGENTDYSQELYDIIKSSEPFIKDTQNTFDLTVGTVSDLWNKTFENGILPDENELNDALKTVDYNSLVFENDIVKKTISTQKINLGAVAKGYIADRISDYLDDNKINNALINLGGNIYAKGRNQNGKKWNVGVLDPADNNSVLLTVEVSDKFVITSGNYLRYADINSKRYHHIIDAKTGYPVDNELNSVTVVSDSGFNGDALSTVCFLLGFEKSKPILEKYNACGIFATKDNKIYYSKDLREQIHKKADNYEFIEF